MIDIDKCCNETDVAPWCYKVLGDGLDELTFQRSIGLFRDMSNMKGKQIGKKIFNEFHSLMPAIVMSHLSTIICPPSTDDACQDPPHHERTSAVALIICTTIISGFEQIHESNLSLDLKDLVCSGQICSYMETFNT